MSKWAFWTIMWNHFISMFGFEPVEFRIKDYDFYNMSTTDFTLKLLGSLILWLVWFGLDLAAFSIVAPYYAVWYTFNNWTSWADMAIEEHK